MEIEYNALRVTYTNEIVKNYSFQDFVALGAKDLDELIALVLLKDKGAFRRLHESGGAVAKPGRITKCTRYTLLCEYMHVILIISIC